MPWPRPDQYQTAVQNPNLNFADAELRAGTVASTKLGLPRVMSGNFATVYRVHCGKRDWAIRCFLRDVEDSRDRYRAIHRTLETARLPYTLGFEYLDQGISVDGHWYPILKMEWAEGEQLDRYIERNRNDRGVLTRLADDWLGMIQALEQVPLAHGDLQHGNVLVVNGALKLVDYDGMFVSALAGRGSHENGHPNYQHPGRTARDFGRELDRFSSWNIYLSILAVSRDPNLWDVLNGGDECLLFRRADFDDPAGSAAFKQLLSHSDSRVQTIAGTVRGFLSEAPARVPALTEQALAPPKVSGAARGTNARKNGAAIGPAHGPTSRPTPAPLLPEASPASREWFNQLLQRVVPPAAAPPPALTASGPVGVASWLPSLLRAANPGPPAAEQSFGHVSSVPRACAEYSAVLCCVALVISVVASGSSALPLVGLVCAAAAGANFLVVTTWFRRVPVVAEKRNLQARRHHHESQLRSLTERLDVLRGERDAALRAFQEWSCAAPGKRDSLQEQERQEEQRAAGRIQGDLDLIDAQLQRLAQHRQDVVQQRVDQMQQSHVETRLRQTSIWSASVPGVGDLMKLRLKAAGIHSAADVVPGKVASVSGFGPQRANAMLAWRNSVEAVARSQAPQTLPMPARQILELVFTSKRKNLEAQRMNAERRKPTELQAVHNLYAQKQKELESEVLDVVGRHYRRLSDLDADITKMTRERDRHETEFKSADRELAGYAAITFRTYLLAAYLQRTAGKQTSTP